MKRFAVVVLAGLLLGGVALASEIDGAWTFVFQTDGGERMLPMTFQVTGREVSGTTQGETPVKGTYADNELLLDFPFYSEETGISGNLQIRGKHKEGKISGDWSFVEYSGTFTATKQ